METRSPAVNKAARRAELRAAQTRSIDIPVEIRGLVEGRLYVDAPPLGHTRLTDWIERHKDTLGRRYTSEMARRLDRVAEYRSN